MKNIVDMEKALQGKKLHDLSKEEMLNAKRTAFLIYR